MTPARSRFRFPFHLGPIRPAVVLLAVSALAAVAWASYHLSSESGRASKRRIDSQRLEFYSASLEALIEKYEQLPHVLALERDLHAALEAPADPARIAAANRFLQTVVHKTNTMAAYLLDHQGNTLASSNWQMPDSFVGRNFAYRPYFRDALRGETGRFYGIGTTSRQPGYFHAAPVKRSAPTGPVIGVVTVKVSLQPFEQALARSGEALLVADRDGVIFLSAIPQWKYRVLAPLAPPVAARLAEIQQYSGFPLDLLQPGNPVLTDGPVQTLSLGWPHDTGKRQADYLVQSRRAGRLGWRVVMVSALDDVAASAGVLAAAVALAGAFALASAGVVHQRRRRLEDRRRARQELQRACDELETRLAENAVHLTQANTLLGQRVDELKRAESILRETQDAAHQAGKLAMLGQMAAGITHELNQPLAALTTLSDNAAKFIERGSVDPARENLELIAQLAERMGRIVGQLRTFARKTPTTLTPVKVRDALAHALLLVEPRRKDIGVAVELHQPEAPLEVIAEAGRLEQVLVNLLRNGIDAMESGNERRLVLRVVPGRNGVTVYVRDHGQGLAPEVVGHLFEPFFTTKPAGKGLGLGLAISQAIVQSFGGTLTAANAEGGGAEFELFLPSTVG